MTAQRHIIGKQILEVRIRKRPGARAGDYHAVLSRLQCEKIQPVLEAVLDDLCPPGQALRIPHLVLDIGEININDADTGWILLLAARLREGIQPYVDELLAYEQQTASENNTTTPKPGAAFSRAGSPSKTHNLTGLPFRNTNQPLSERSDQPEPGPVHFPTDKAASLTPAAAWEALEVFLLHGQLPWWTGNRPGRHFLDEVLDQLTVFPALEARVHLQRITRVDTARQRLIAQCTDEQLLRLLEGVQTPAPLVPWVHLFRNVWNGRPDALAEPIAPARWREMYWQAIWQQLFFDWPAAETALQDWAQRVLWQLVHSVPLPPEKWLDTAIGILSGNYGEAPVAARWLAALQRVRGEISTMKPATGTTTEYPMQTLAAPIAGVARSHPDNRVPRLTPDIPPQATNPQFPLPDTAPESPPAAGPGPSAQQPAAPVLPGNRPAAFRQTSLPPTPEAIYLDNAGLILLAPFLPRLLENMGWVEQKAFVDPIARQRAALFLQFLVDGEAAPAPEYLLPLNKLLCGLAAEEVMEPQKPFSAEEQAAGEAFLQAVIAHAPVLKKMSIQGFRGTFLWRAGVLRPEEHQWLLRVERQDFDLVLDRFPWSFQLIKLPWMSRAIYTEW